MNTTSTASSPDPPRRDRHAWRTNALPSVMLGAGPACDFFRHFGHPQQTLLGAGTETMAGASTTSVLSGSASASSSPASRSGLLELTVHALFLQLSAYMAKIQQRGTSSTPSTSSATVGALYAAQFVEFPRKVNKANQTEFSGFNKYFRCVVSEAGKKLLTKHGWTGQAAQMVAQEQWVSLWIHWFRNGHPTMTNTFFDHVAVAAQLYETLQEERADFSSVSFPNKELVNSCISIEHRQGQEVVRLFPDRIRAVTQLILGQISPQLPERESSLFNPASTAGSSASSPASPDFNASSESDAPSAVSVLPQPAWLPAQSFPLPVQTSSAVSLVDHSAWPMAQHAPSIGTQLSTQPPPPPPPRVLPPTYQLPYDVTATLHAAAAQQSSPYIHQLEYVPCTGLPSVDPTFADTEMMSDDSHGSQPFVDSQVSNFDHDGLSQFVQNGGYEGHAHDFFFHPYCDLGFEREELCFESFPTPGVDW